MDPPVAGGLSAKAPEEKGTGFGQSIATEEVEDLGGTISVGAGETGRVWFVLPGLAET